jgi:hypothetical protein
MKQGAGGHVLQKKFACGNLMSVSLNVKTDFKHGRYRTSIKHPSIILSFHKNTHRKFYGACGLTIPIPGGITGGGGGHTEQSNLPFIFTGKYAYMLRC